jgi:hypothetical protein
MPRTKTKIIKSEASYLTVGHDVFSRGSGFFNSKNPNYIWGFKTGRVSKWAETPKCKGHSDVPNWHGDDWSFWGRYDAKRQVISCVISCDGVNSFRHLPKLLVSQLEQHFPHVKKILVF